MCLGKKFTRWRLGRFQTGSVHLTFVQGPLCTRFCWSCFHIVAEKPSVTVHSSENAEACCSFLNTASTSHQQMGPQSHRNGSPCGSGPCVHVMGPQLFWCSRERPLWESLVCSLVMPLLQSLPVQGHAALPSVRVTWMALYFRTAATRCRVLSKSR